MTLEQMNWALGTLSAYRPLLDTEVAGCLRRMLGALTAADGAAAAEAYAALFHALRAGGCQGLGEWFHRALVDDASPYAELAERGGSDPALEAAARREIALFRALAELDCGALKDAVKKAAPAGFAPVAEGLPQWEAGCPFTFEDLTEFYRTHGAGAFARCRAFLWERDRLLPVPCPDCPGPEEMLGYELQRDQVEANTRALLEGRAVNNVLLYGDAGTGKSSTVKAICNEFAAEGLRLVEVKKNQLYQIPDLMDKLAANPLKFILFIDDLSFTANDDNFAALKAILEGSVGGRARNIAVYATSNRRHLIKETLSDRTGDDIHEADTRQELMSLSARFGLTVTFQRPEKARFEVILTELAKQHGIEMPHDELLTKAEAFAIRAGGRSPRVAKQFIEQCAAGVQK